MMHLKINIARQLILHNFSTVVVNFDKNRLCILCIRIIDLGNITLTALQICNAKFYTLCKYIYRHVSVFDVFDERPDKVIHKKELTSAIRL